MAVDRIMTIDRIITIDRIMTTDRIMSTGSAVSLDTFAGGLHGVIDVLSAQARRQAKNNKMLDLFLEQKRPARPGSRVESIYEPYWDEGHWVFFRPPTTTTVTVEGRSTTTPTMTKVTKFDPKKKTKTPSLATFHHCNIACLNTYKDYGKVCARQYMILYKTIHWNYVYRTFDNVCALENYNCHDENKTYQMIYKGPCEETELGHDVPITPSETGYDSEANKYLEPFGIKPFHSHYYIKVVHPAETLDIDEDY